MRLYFTCTSCQVSKEHLLFLQFYTIANISIKDLREGHTEQDIMSSRCSLVVTSPIPAWPFWWLQMPTEGKTKEQALCQTSVQKLLVKLSSPDQFKNWDGGGGRGSRKWMAVKTNREWMEKFIPFNAYKMPSRLKCASIFKISSYKQNYQDAFSKIWVIPK